MKSMRLPIILTFLSVILAFMAGYLFLSLRSTIQPKFSVTDIGRIKENFKATAHPTEEIVLQLLFPQGFGNTFIDPEQTIVQSRNYSFEIIQKLYKSLQFCDGIKFQNIEDQSLLKATKWIDFKCKKISKLPPNFFDTAPFFFPLGQSYAYLAFENKEALGFEKDWFKDHLPFFHVTELKYLESLGLDLEKSRKKMSELNLDSLQAIAKGEDLIISDKDVLYKQVASFNKSSQGVENFQFASGYTVFSRKNWDEFLYSYNVKASAFQNGDLCSYRDGSICWREEDSGLIRKIETPTAIMFIFSSMFAIISLLWSWQKFKHQKFAEEKKRFALQTLTHELRTPITSLKISSEEILNNFDLLPEGLKGSLIRMCDDVEKLKRLTEISKAYLTSESHSELIKFNFQSVDSLNEYLKDSLEKYQDQISIKFLFKDRSFRLDKYWVSLCLKNLVENAIQHGASPIEVNAQVVNNKLYLSVSDAGHCKEQLLKMSSPFYKGKASQGLGLGLAIVQAVAKSMVAEFRFSAQPTRFELILVEPS